MRMTVRRRRTWWIVVGWTGTSAGRQTLWSSSVARVVGLLFALNFVHFEVAQCWELRPGRARSQQMSSVLFATQSGMFESRGHTWCQCRGTSKCVAKRLECRRSGTRAAYIPACRVHDGEWSQGVVDERLYTNARRGRRSVSSSGSGGCSSGTLDEQIWHFPETDAEGRYADRGLP